MKLFGTDGIRFEYTEESNSTAYLLGTALVRLSGKLQPVIIVGRDTRTSGERLLSAFISGVMDAGGSPVNIGILPTDAVSYFTRTTGASFGVMISASHNPPEYNGLKVFDFKGHKLSLGVCEEAERIILEEKVYINPVIELPVVRNAEEIYVKHLSSHIEPLDGMRILLDCANGSASGVAKKAFERCGAEVVAINDSLNGELINVKCGAAYENTFEDIQDISSYDLAFAFDGDADRLKVYEKGRHIHSEKVFYIYCRYFHLVDKLRAKAVGTVLTNNGLERSLNKLGISLLRSNVGDGAVREIMDKTGAVFGGESSGHYINSLYTSTSDAIMNALVLCNIKKQVGSLYEYSEECALTDSFTFNVDARGKDDGYISLLDGKIRKRFPEVHASVRKSGTEPKIRVFIQGDRLNKCLIKEFFDKEI